MATQHYTFSLDSFTILNTRSRHQDTDFVAISLAVTGQPPMTKTRAMGDLNNGTYTTGLAFENVAVDDDQGVIFSYLIVNNGHSDPSQVEKDLEGAVSTLANQGAQALAKIIAQGIGSAVGAALGASLGSAIGTAAVPILGTALGALAGWAVGQLESVIWADCDGPVGAGVHAFTGAQLRASTHNGGKIATTDNTPGTDSPAGCRTSNYNVNWSIVRATAHDLRFAVIMAPANQPYQWWYGLTGEQVAQKLQASNMQLRNISAYVDLDDTVKFTAIMGPSDRESWWWYWGQTAEQVGSLLEQNKAQLVDISPYVGPDGVLKFAVIMVGAKSQWWWYWGQTGDQIGPLLQQNKAVLTKLSPYWYLGALRFAVIMAPYTGQTWWWWWGQTAEQVGSLLQQNKAVLTDIAAYVDHSDNLRFAVLMAPPSGPWPGWWFGLDANGISQKINSTQARPAVLTPYFI